MNQTAPKVCQLAHPGFRMLGEPVFRLSEGARVPSMVVQLENHEAVLPLKSVAREFKVDPETADGEMLDLIEQGLDFVIAIRLGDPLPSEVTGGTASWKPSEDFLQIAISRLRHDLVRCVFVRMGRKFTVAGSPGPGWEHVIANRCLLKEAITGATAHLPGSNETHIETLLGNIGDELACIEALRPTLTKGIGFLKDKLFRISMNQVPTSRRDTVTQVQTLARRGLKGITDRFDQVDARLDDVLSMLRDVDGAVAALRRDRDWMFRTKQAWEPLFNDWKAAPSQVDEFLYKTIERSYAFLAPRFMSFQEWSVVDAKPKAAEAKVRIW